VQLLASLLTPQTPEDMQAAAIQMLGQTGDLGVPGLLLKSWKSFTPELRSQVLDALLSRPIWARYALSALEQKQILPSEVDLVRRQALLNNPNAEIRTAAAKIFVRQSEPERTKVIEKYLLPIVSSKGDVQAGSKVFAKHCATCHQLGNLGQKVGPELASVADKTPEGLLTAILDPNRAVESRYLNYVAATKEGLIVSGLLLSETSTSVTLISADGKKHGILRKDLDELASTGKSAMPEGFEKDLPEREMIDLIAFLQGSIPVPQRKTFPGNDGKSLVLEKEHENLGYWSSPDDHVVWTVAVPRAGAYQVWLQWACAANSAGNHYQIAAAGERIQGKVEGTSSWDNYRRARVGQVRLEAGQVEVRMEALGPIRGALMDLKEIQLVPAP
jgi:putative heme-binding domain-containing protein